MITEQQKIEALLRPRVIVENLWPNCDYGVGDILIKESGYYSWLSAGSYFDKLKPADVEPYPYLMRPLNWWEKRSVEEMPEYVKVKETGEVCRVTRYYINHNFACFYTGELEKRGKLKGTETPYNLKACIPATESEYNNYINSKK